MKPKQIMPIMALLSAVLFGNAVSAQNVTPPNTMSASNSVPNEPDNDDQPSRAFTNSVVKPSNKSDSRPRTVPRSVRQPLIYAAPHSVDVQLPLLDVEQLNQEDLMNAQKSRSQRIGVVRQLLSSVALTGEQATAGRIQTANAGERLWTVTIESPNAEALRVHLENVRLPVGAQVIVYNTNNPSEAYGPYESRDLYGGIDLWTETISGSSVTVELFAPNSIDVSKVGLEIREISHTYVRFADLLRPQEGTCHNDVTCNTSWSSEAAGVARIAYVSGASSFVCSGSLLVLLCQKDKSVRKQGYERDSEATTDIARAEC